MPSFELEPGQQWLKGVRRVPSPNCDARPPGSGIELLVIHGISLPPGCYGGPYIDQLFTNCLDQSTHDYFKSICGLRVSAHLLIERDGRVTQYVPFNLRAWHAGESLFQGRPACNDYSIGIELEGCDDEVYDPRQYPVLAGIVRVLQRQWPILTTERMVGHSDIAPGRKTDPGPTFDRQLFLSLLA